MQGDPKAGQSAHGQSAEMKRIDVERIGQRENIAGQLLERVRAWRDLALPVAARVVAQDAMRFREGRHLRVPHSEIRA